MEYRVTRGIWWFVLDENFNKSVCIIQASKASLQIVKFFR